MEEIGFRGEELERLMQRSWEGVTIDDARGRVTCVRRIDQRMDELCGRLERAAVLAEKEFQNVQFEKQRETNGESIALLAKHLGIDDKFACRIFETIGGDPLAMRQFLDWYPSFVLDGRDLEYIRRLFAGAEVAIPCGANFDEVKDCVFYIARNLERVFGHMPSLDVKKCVRFAVAVYHLTMRRIERMSEEIDT